jgi:hypothetical protein
MQATIVTANGTALKVSESENADLFWGIRGGGSNFGVCVEFVLRLHPQRRTVFGGNIIFPAVVLDKLMKVLIQWWSTVKDNEGILQFLGRDPDGHVSDGYLMVDSSTQLTTLFRISFYSPCFTTDLRKKGARISRNFMNSVSDAVEMSYFW